MTTALAQPSTLLAELELACRRWAQRPALVAPARSLTYGELWAAALAQAAWYGEHAGVRPGDRVLCSLPNRAEHLITVAAAWASGAVHVGLDHDLTIPELSWLVEHTGAAALVVARDHPHAAALPGLQVEHPGLRLLWTDQVPSPDQGRRDEPLARPGPDDAATIIFSSGTTGRPKGAVAGHGRFVEGWLGLSASAGFRPDDVHLGQVPISHGYGLQLAAMALLSGGSLVLMERFSADAAIDLIAGHGVSVLNGTPSHYIGVLDAVDRRRERGEPAPVQSLRRGIGSADHFAPRLLLRIFDELGLDFMNMYGSNVGFGVATMDRELMLRGSVGRPEPGTFAIMDAARRRLPAGLVGELAFGFDPDETRLWAPPEGGDPMLDEVGHWYYPGDMARTDAEGNLYLCGRAGHRVNRGGEKIDPAEVANELFGLEGVADAAVIGTPDDFLGEVVCACVVPRSLDRPPRLADLRRALEGRLAPHKLPERLAIVDEVPRTPNGKVDVARLRDRALASDRGEQVRRERRPAVAGAEEATRPAAGVDDDRLAGAAARLACHVREARGALPGRLPVVLDAILEAAVRYVRDPHGEAEERSPYLRPALAAADPRVREAFESVLTPPAAPASEEARQVSFPDALRAIADTVSRLHRLSDDAERLALRLLLGSALRDMIPHEHLPRGRELNLAAIALACLGRLQSDAVLYVGRPDFLTGGELEELAHEAAHHREEAALVHHYRNADLGPAAHRFATSDGLRALVSELAGPAAPVGYGKYVYVDETTTGLGVHVGGQPFAINAELKLAHEHPGGEPGRLVLWPPYAPRQPLDVAPGELVVWYAGGVPHFRDEPRPGERLTTVSVFFEPLR